MRKLLTLILAISSVSIFARQISQNEAKIIATDFIQSSIHPKKGEQLVANLITAPHSTVRENIQQYYVFDIADTSGFVIVSANRGTILGYSTQNNFDFNRIPPQLALLLEQYEEKTNTLSIQPQLESSCSLSRSEITNENDEILLATANWGQNYPYNSKCPFINGTQAPSGCGATAAAILMKYYNWPKQGRLKGEYVDLNGHALTDFSSYNFKYEDMLDDYLESNCPQSSIDEVGNLMYAAGRALNTIYFQNESAVQSIVIGYGLVKYFSFSPKYKHLYSNNYTQTEWTNIIKDELKKLHPVIYCIPKHAFICDGFKDDMLHVNWGWNGISNGYYSPDLISGNPQDIHTVDIGLTPEIDAPEIGDIFIDNGDATGLIPYNMGVRTNVKDIETGIPFDLYIETLNADAFHETLPNPSIGVVLMDSEENLKEWLFAIDDIYLEDPRLVKESSGFNGHSGLKIKIKDLIANSNISPNDRIQLVTQDSKKNWIKVFCINCDTGNCDTGIPIVDNDLQMSTIDLSTNISEDQIYYIFERGIDSISFIGEKITRFIAPIFSQEGKPMSMFATLDGSIIYTERYDCGIQIDYSPTELKHNLCIKQIDPDNTTELIIDNKTPGQIQSLVDNSILEKLSSLKIIGKVDQQDLNWVYNYLPILETLDLSEAELIGEFEFNNEIICGLLKGQIGRLKCIHLPSNAKEIPDGTFGYFESLHTLYIPETVNYIGDAAFQGANGMKHLILKGMEPCNITEYTFPYETYYSQISLHVPIGASENYRNHQIWGKFKNIYEGVPTVYDFWEKDIHYHGTESGLSVIGWAPEKYLMENLTVIKDKEFNGKSTRVTSIMGHLNAIFLPIDLTIPETIVEIGDQAFLGALLNTIVCENPVPPIIYESTFSQNSYENSTLVVPDEGLDAYKKHPLWSQFKNLISKSNAGSICGVNLLPFSDIKKIEVYSLTGNLILNVHNQEQLKNLAPGIYIIRNGTTSYKIKIP